jgi:uncharacterized protein YjhX (UPF0386 family)
MEFSSYTRRFLNMLANEGKIALRKDKNRKYWRLIPNEAAIEDNTVAETSHL